MTPENPVDNSAGATRPRLIPSTRFTLALLVFFAFIIQYSQRVNLPMGIVCMVNRKKPIDPLPTADVETRIGNDGINTYLNTTIATQTISSVAIEKTGFLDDKQFDWNELQQQLLLGGYWAGYIFTQVPGR